MHIFIPVYITDDVVKFIAPKLLKSSGPGGTDSEDLKGLLLKFVEDGKKLCIIVEMFLTGWSIIICPGHHIMHLYLFA